MQILDLYCVRCRGRAYEDDGGLTCFICGRLLGILPIPQPRIRPVQPVDCGLGRRIAYSPELKAICIQWMIEGESIVDVGDVTGVGRSTLEKWRKIERKRLGLSLPPRPTFSPEFKAACAERLLAGETLEALSEETGVKVITLRDWRQKARRLAATG